MLDKATAITEVMRRLQKMEPGDGLELLTWKQDRSLVLLKQGEDSFEIHEHGFEEQVFHVEHSGLKKLLKKLLKREFPRSLKIRVKVRKGK